MLWHEAYTQAVQPSPEEIAVYIGGQGRVLWEDLAGYMENAYKSKPKYQYSGCGGKPGWNVKYAKSGQNFGTLYPEENGFSVLVVVSYRLEADMEAAAREMTAETAQRWSEAGDFMKNGRWMMFRIDTPELLADYKRIMGVKLAVKE